MLLLRRIATAVVLLAATAVLILSVYLLWNARQWDYLPLHPTYSSELDARAQAFEQKLEIYTRRVNDMQLLVVLLLGTSGVFMILFMLTADFAARASRRKMDQALTAAKNQLDATARELRLLKEEANKAIQHQAREAAARLEAIQQAARAKMQDLETKTREAPPVLEPLERELEEIRKRIEALATVARATDEQQQEISQYEQALAAVDLIYGRQLGTHLVQIHRALTKYYRSRDNSRARFYATRAYAANPTDFQLANDIGTLALESHPPDYAQARKYFEVSLILRGEQQRARYGLALVARGEGNLSAARELLEAAGKISAWEMAPDEGGAASVHYQLACVLARGGEFARAAEELDASFANRSRELEEALTRDTEEGGDLYAFANTPPYEDTVNDLLLNVLLDKG
ncbi:MAG TPA: hypothetical protein VKU01_03475 [Bryobacteraceae bacterium]|nr:hypothetical protein [Bryobacteraceae bacterium]